MGYSLDPKKRDVERIAARDRQRIRRAALTPEEREECRRAHREYCTTPEQRAKGRERTAAWIQRQTDRGLCIVCTDRATAGRYCERHWYITIGRGAGLTEKNGGIALIRRIWEEQSGHCALTGDRLTRGLNASLDHRVPVARGGDCSRENLRWVIRQANSMKLDFSEEEFVEMCRKVVAHQDHMRDGRN